MPKAQRLPTVEQNCLHVDTFIFKFVKERPKASEEVQIWFFAQTLLRFFEFGWYLVDDGLNFKGADRLSFYLQALRKMFFGCAHNFEPCGEKCFLLFYLLIDSFFERLLLILWQILECCEIDKPAVSWCWIVQVQSAIGGDFVSKAFRIRKIFVDINRTGKFIKCEGT